MKFFLPILFVSILQNVKLGFSCLFCTLEFAFITPSHTDTVIFKQWKFSVCFLLFSETSYYFYCNLKISRHGYFLITFSFLQHMIFKKSWLSQKTLSCWIFLKFQSIYLAILESPIISIISFSGFILFHHFYS